MKIIKYIGTIALLMLLFCATTMAADNQQLIAQGNKFYTENNYTQAIAAYEEVVNSGNSSAELYFNLGNAYYKNSQITLAILNYERAKRLAPNNEDIDFNLQLANQKTIDKVEALPEMWIGTWYRGIISSYHSNTWAWASIVLFVTFVGGLIFFLLSDKRAVKKITFAVAVLALLLSVVTFTFSARQKNAMLNRNSAIVFTPALKAKSSPDDKSTDLFWIHEGTKVNILTRNSGWAEILLKDGKRGWVKESDVEVI